MAAPLEHVPESIMLGHFINGLTKDIKAEARLINPLNLEQAMEVASRIEEKNKVTGLRKNLAPVIATQDR